MPTRNVNLTDHYDRFIDTSIAEGRFSNVSEAVRAGLHLLERQAAEDKTRLEWLRGTTEESFAALDRGEGVQLDSADDIDACVDDVLRQRRAMTRTPRPNGGGPTRSGRFEGGVGGSHHSVIRDAMNTFTLEEWLQEHTSVSDADFAKDPCRNRIAVVLSRTHHISYHMGQIILTQNPPRD